MLGDSKSCTLKASEKLQVKKSVHKITNLDASNSTNDVTAYVESLSVRVTSCFELPRGPRQPLGNKSFRLCIFAAGRAKLLTRSNWSTGVIIQDWISKTKNADTQIAPSTNGSSPTRRVWNDDQADHSLHGYILNRVYLNVNQPGS